MWLAQLTPDGAGDALAEFVVAQGNQHLLFLYKKKKRPPAPRCQTQAVNGRGMQLQPSSCRRK